MVTGVRQFPLEQAASAAPAAVGPFLWGPENAPLDVLLTRLLGPRHLRPRHLGPVTVYGPSGTGKSLLLHHLCHYWNTQQPAQAGQLVSSARDWAQDFQAAQASAQLVEWRTTQRTWRLFALDDVGALLRFPGAQRELGSLLDDLLSLDIPVVISARVVPAAMPLSPALVSRLSGGLCLPLVLPAQPARRAFISQVSRRHPWQLDDAALDWLSEQTGGNFFDIQNTLAAHLAHRRGRLSRHELQSLFPLGGSKQHRSDQQLARRPAVQLLGRLVSRYFQVTVRDLKGKSRRKTLVRARSIACHVARTQLGMSYYEIGKWLGNRDHSTIMHACRQANKLLQNEPELAAWVSEVAASVKRKSCEH